jgi:hypothetical protein
VHSAPSAPRRLTIFIHERFLIDALVDPRRQHDVFVFRPAM